MRWHTYVDNRQRQGLTWPRQSFLIYNIQFYYYFYTAAAAVVTIRLLFHLPEEKSTRETGGRTVHFTSHRAIKKAWHYTIHALYIELYRVHPSDCLCTRAYVTRVIEYTSYHTAVRTRSSVYSLYTIIIIPKLTNHILLSPSVNFGTPTLTRTITLFHVHTSARSIVTSGAEIFMVTPVWTTKCKPWVCSGLNENSSTSFFTRSIWKHTTRNHKQHNILIGGDTTLWYIWWTREYHNTRYHTCTLLVVYAGGERTVKYAHDAHSDTKNKYI